MNAILERINSAGDGFVGYAVPMLVQSSVLIAVLLLADLVLRRKVRAVFRYWLWMLVLVKLVLPISLSSPVSVGYWFGDELASVKISEAKVVAEAASLSEVSGAEPIEEASEVEVVKPAVGVEGEVVSAVDSGLMVSAVVVTWQGVVFLVWLFVVVVMGLLLLQRAIFVNGLVGQAKEAGGLMADALKYCCGCIGVRGKVGLKVSVNAASPAVCGLFRPVILVPQDLGGSLGAGGLRAVLLHELSHIKRGDLWVNLVQTVLQIVYFYNPLLWLANSMIRRVREEAVDEMVQVAMGEKAREYPETLVNVARQVFRRPALSLRLIGVVESKSTLKGRVRRMLSRPIPKSAKLGMLGLAGIVFIGCVLLPMAKAAVGRPEFVIKGTVTDAETGQPIAGAKVGDVERYAEGKQWTTTDANGNYNYKTWYEEHDVKCESSGYKTQNKVLLTKLLGSEKERVEDFQLQPEIADPKLASRLQSLVEDFFERNYRDITARKTIEWGEPAVDAGGNMSIRYKYEATIWDKDKIITDQLFVFDKNGKLLSYDKISPFPVGSKQWLQERVEEFFKNNYRDITARKTLEWGEPQQNKDGSYSIHYKYKATIWDKDKIISDELFTFDKDGKFISVKKLGQNKDDTEFEVEKNTDQGERSVGFRDVIEEVLPAIEGRQAKLLDVDTGKWGTKADFGENDRETHKWVRDNGLDLLGVNSGKEQGLLSFDVAVLPVKNVDWERLTAREVTANRLLDQMEANKITSMMPMEAPDRPATYLFRTRENGIGILQIVDFTNNPKGVKIRYKIVEGTGSENPDVEVEWKKQMEMTGGIKSDEETKPAIGREQLNEAIYKQLDEIVDLSALTPKTPFGEAIEKIKYSVEPPLNILVLWGDLFDNADVNKATPINIDAVPAVSLGTALKLLLRALSVVKGIDYVVEDGVIYIATVESLPKKFETRVYDVGAADAEYIARLVSLTVEPESWGRGEGMVTSYQGGKLVVFQTYEIHRKIENLLQGLRLPSDVAVESTAQPMAKAETEEMQSDEVKQIIEQAVMTISTCAETDPRVKQSLESLQGLDKQAVVKELVKFLDSDKNTVRRSAIYILWQGNIESIGPAVPHLQNLCSHEEEYTRGMAALALGARKVEPAFDTLCNMTLNDSSAYARRCAAYALGLMGNPEAKDVLEKALKDSDFNVRNNAEAALTMLSQVEKPKSEKTDVQVEIESNVKKSQNDIRREKITEARSDPQIIRKVALDLFQKIQNTDYDYFLSNFDAWEQFPMVKYYNCYRDYPTLVQWICKTFKQNPIVSIELGDVSFDEQWPRIYYKLILNDGAILEGDLHFEYHFYHGNEGRWYGIHGHFYEGPETPYKTHGLDWHLQDEVIKRPNLKTDVQVEVSKSPLQTKGGKRFGAVIENVLPVTEGRSEKLLDIDTGRWDTKADFGENDRETHKWVRDNGLDLLGVFEKEQFGLLAFDMAVLPVKNTDWERLTAEEVVANWSLAQMEANKITPMTPMEAPDRPATYLFRTRENGIGILQIVDFTDNPKGVKIQYKIVEGTGSENPDVQVEGTAQPMEEAAAEPVVLAREFVGLLVKGEFSAATKNFDAIMRQAMPPERLADVWKGLVGQSGAFKEEVGVRTERMPGFDIVYVTCEFEKGPLDIKVVYDRERQVCGLWFVPVPQEILESYKNKRKIGAGELEPEVDLSSVEATVISFTKAAAVGDVDLALACFASDSHDYEDMKTILTGEATNPFRMLLESIDTEKPITIVEKDEKDGRCSVVWKVTFKRDVTIEGQTFRAGDTFDLDGNLKEVEGRWLIEGI
jgi:beta-lactamase regulating signal transducer with metallopeptidase domain/HEAT repeat protein